MKICLINNLYPPLTVGGAERIVELIAKGLVKTEHQVVVITTCLETEKNIIANGSFKLYRLNPGNIYHYCQSSGMPVFKKLIWHFIDIFGCKACRKVKQVLKKEQPDVVFTHNLKGFSYKIPKLISKLKIKHVHTLHDYQLIDPHGSLFRQGRNLEKLPLAMNIYKNICKYLFSNIDLVISPSKFVLNKHLEYGFFKNSKKEVLFNPAIFPVSNLKHQTSDKIRLLYLGQIEEHKGIKFLVEAFKDYQNSNFELRIVGDGSLLKNLRLTTHDSRLNFHGKVSHDGISNIFNQSDLTVIPSLWWDNSPTVIYESYAHKVPVLVSDSGGSKELVKDGKTGYIYKSGDKSSFIACIDKIAQNRANLADFGMSGYEFIQQYSVDNYINKLLELCRDLKK